MNNTAREKAIEAELKSTYPDIEFKVKLFEDGTGCLEYTSGPDREKIGHILRKFNFEGEIAVHLTPEEIEAKEALRAEQIKYAKSPEGRKKIVDSNRAIQIALDKKRRENHPEEYDDTLSDFYKGTQDDGGVYDEEDDIMRALSNGEGDKIGMG